MTEVWPRRFPTLESAAPYARNPEALANNVYASRLGNGDASTGDGYLYRGRGLMQVTGRDNYRALGFENNPEALAEPATAASTAAQWWANHNLPGRSTSELNRSNFDAISQTVNGGNHGSDARWNAYQRALTALRPGG
jgi:predicted chitinase